MSQQAAQFPLLAKINSPADLRLLPETDLVTLANELRQFLMSELDQCGGHFGANLGAVELTLALHFVFDTPHDRLVWDVGHQAYPHKVITGRRDQLRTIRQPQGLAPFPKRRESEYDTFGTGHSSTSISAALGMALAAQQQGIDRRAIAIIGDGGLTGGMAFEALNHAGALDPNLLVVLNDNDMSISENVGALTHYFGRILSGKAYTALREGGKKILASMPPISRVAKKTETHLKGMIIPGTLFEELGFNYVGPIDGHDLPGLIKTLRNLRHLQGAKLLHIITTKGKGYPPAEAQQIKYHAVNAGFHSHSGATPAAQPKSNPTYSQTFGAWLCDMAEQDPKLVAITPAMREGSGMVEFSKRFPKQYHDVGIAEQHAVTLAAGFACEGLKPIVAIYSTFLQRGYDQLIHDVALQNLDVTFAIDRAGLVGADGPTHAGSFDLSYLRCLPNMVIMAPSNQSECRRMLSTAYHHAGPAAVRYPRGSGPDQEIDPSLACIPIGQAAVCRRGQRVAILAFGSLTQAAMQAGERLNATVVNMRFIKPLDSKLLQQLIQHYDLLVTVEENSRHGGAGSAVSEWLNQFNRPPPLLILGLPDRFLEHGKPPQMLAECGLDDNGIVQAIQQRLASMPIPKPSVAVD